MCDSKQLQGHGDIIFVSDAEVATYFFCIANERAALLACVVFASNGPCLLHACRCSWDACSGLLADIGLMLEHAELCAGMAPGADAYRLAYLPHAARLTRSRLGLFCAMGWAALTAKVITGFFVGFLSRPWQCTVYIYAPRMHTEVDKLESGVLHASSQMPQ